MEAVCDFFLFSYTIFFLAFADDSLRVLVTNNLPLLQTLAGCVEKYLGDCGRRWVDLGSIFSRMTIKPKPKILSNK